MEEKLKGLERFLNYSIEYNPHKTNYQEISEYLEEVYGDEEVIEREKVIKENSLYEIRVYQSTAVGFMQIAGYSLKSVLDRMIYLIQLED